MTGGSAWHGASRRWLRALLLLGVLLTGGCSARPGTKEPHLPSARGEYYVGGAVARPGAYSLRGDVRLRQALRLAGYSKRWRKDARVLLIRRGDGSREQHLDVAFAPLFDSGSGNVLLQAEDQVIFSAAGRPIITHCGPVERRYFVYN